MISESEIYDRHLSIPLKRCYDIDQELVLSNYLSKPDIFIHTTENHLSIDKAIQLLVLHVSYLTQKGIRNFSYRCYMQEIMVVIIP